MSRRNVTNVAASVRERLHTFAKSQGLPFQEVLTLYAMERFLYRLSKGPFAKRYVLKGAMMMRVWDDSLARPTMDIDLHSPRTEDARSLYQTVKSTLESAVADDGLVFDTGSIRVDEIRAQQKYRGLRVRFVASLGVARTTVQLDVGFGDVVIPKPGKVAFPILLNHPQPLLLGYPPEASVAEKFSAMVDLGAANSRMKDFYDVWVLAGNMEFDGATLSASMQATFKRRNLPVPAAEPLALTPEFFGNPVKMRQWDVFVKKIRAHGAPPIDDITERLRTFLMPVARALAANTLLDRRWTPKKGWGKVR